jgi:hypothetical protein
MRCLTAISEYASSGRSSGRVEAQFGRIAFMR